MNTEMLTASQLRILDDLKAWAAGDSYSIAEAVKWGPELLPIISDLTDRLHAEQLRRESAERAIDEVIEEGSRNPCFDYRISFPKDSKDMNNG